MNISLLFPFPPSIMAQMQAHDFHQQLEIRVWLKPFTGLLCLDSQEDEDCFAFDIIPKAPEITK